MERHSLQCLVANAMILAFSCSCIVKKPEPGVLTAAEYEALPAIRMQIEEQNEAELTEIAHRREAERQRQLAEAQKRKEARDRAIAARYVRCAAMIFGQDTCQSMAEELFEGLDAPGGIKVSKLAASAGCAAALQQIEQGYVDGTDVLLSVAADVALESDSTVLQVGAVLYMFYEYQECIEG